MYYVIKMTQNIFFWKTLMHAVHISDFFVFVEVVFQKMYKKKIRRQHQPPALRQQFNQLLLINRKQQQSNQLLLAEATGSWYWSFSMMQTALSAMGGTYAIYQSFFILRLGFIFSFACCMHPSFIFFNWSFFILGLCFLFSFTWFMYSSTSFFNT